MSETIASLKSPPRTRGNASLPPGSPRKRLGAMIHLGIVSTMRPGELAALHRDDIDFVRGVIDVRNSIENVRGKLAIVPAKADSARRIPLLPETLDVLRDHLDRMDGENHTSRYVFASPRGKWLRPRLTDAALAEILSEAQAPKATLYALRHTAISLFGESGVHLAVAADLAGHSDKDITANVYTHTGEAQHRDAIERVAALIRSVPTAPIEATEVSAEDSFGSN